MASSQFTHEILLSGAEASISRLPSYEEEDCDYSSDDSYTSNPPPLKELPSALTRQKEGALPSERPAFCLPLELVLSIFAFLAGAARNCASISSYRAYEQQSQVQDTFAALCRVSKTWYYAALPFLYRSPRICSRNYTAFSNTIFAVSMVDPSLKPAPICSLVRRLDLSALLNDGLPSANGRPSANARLISCLQHGLEEFIAPQSAFGYRCIQALAGCPNLRVLDLSVVSRSVSVSLLLSRISGLRRLRSLNFARSSVVIPPRCVLPAVIRQSQISTLPIIGLSQAQPMQVMSEQRLRPGDPPFVWPPHLEHFSLLGPVPVDFVEADALPKTLSSLHLSNCPFTRSATIHGLISALSSRLTTLSIGYPVMCLGANSLDGVLALCPLLTNLYVPSEYITCQLFYQLRTVGEKNGANPGHTSEAGRDRVGIPEGHPLVRLEIDSSGTPIPGRNVTPSDVHRAVDEGRLPYLRVVRVNRHLGWSAGRDGQDARSLSNTIEAYAVIDGGRDLTEVGVWEFEDAEGEGSSCKG